MRTIQHALIVLLLISFPIMVAGKTLVLASSEGPPHTINSGQGFGTHGIDIDVATAVLRRMGYEVKLEFMGLKRAQREVLLGRVDAMTPTFSAKDMAGFYISSPSVEYKPTIFSLKENQYIPQVLLDLQGHSIVTFQDAPGYFDDDFLYLANTQFYQEMADMGIIPELIVKGRYDFAVLDYYIFYYYYRLHDKQRNTAIFDEHQLIDPVTASVAFHDKALRDEFNRALIEFYRDGSYKQVLARYLGQGIKPPSLLLEKLGLNVAIELNEKLEDDAESKVTTEPCQELEPVNKGYH